MKHRRRCLPYTFRFLKTKQHPNKMTVLTAPKQLWRTRGCLTQKQPASGPGPMRICHLNIRKEYAFIYYLCRRKETSKNYHQNEEMAHQIKTQVLLLQKTWVQFEELTWGPTTSCNSTSKASSGLYLILHTPGTNNILRYTHTYA